MKLPLPKMTPKQKFIMFAMATFMIIAVVMMFRAFSSEEVVDGKGSVKVQEGVSNKAVPVTESKATTDTEANRQLEALKEEERQKRLADNAKESFIDRPDLTPKIGKVVSEDAIKRERKNEILSIDDLVKEIAAENEEKKAPEEPKLNVVDTLTEKKRIKDEAVNINFDRASYMSSLRNMSNNIPAYAAIKFDLSVPAAASVRNYQSLTAPSEAINSTPRPQGNNDGIDTLAQDTLARRDEQLNRFLNSSGLLKENDVAASPDSDSPTSTLSSANDEENEYPYKEVKSVGETVYALNKLPINTDGVPIVQLTIVSPGDMNSAVLSGNFTKMRDSVVLRFSTYSKNGKSYPINAIAIDPNTWEAMMADDVDKHYWERYGGVILASIIQGYSQSLQNVTVSDTNAGQRETQQRVESFNDRLMVGFGRAGATLAPHFLRNANRESTVYLYKDRPVAVLFLDNFKVPISD